jgi:hypothetical protein
MRDRDHLEDPGISGRIIFKMDLQMWDGKHGLD